MVKERRDRVALRALWALNASGGFNEAVAAEMLKHPDRGRTGAGPSASWATPGPSPDFDRVAPRGTRGDGSAAPCAAQLACSARRLPAEQALPVIGALMRRAEDAGDRYVPLLLWWAIESKAASDTDAVVALFESKDAWDQPLVRRHLVERACPAPRGRPHRRRLRRVREAAPVPRRATRNRNW